MQTLANKTAIITGASSGIGYASAKLFAAEGANVIVSARRKAELDTLVSEIERAGGKAIAIAGDVREESVHQDMVRAALEFFGGLDIAFNNAGSLGEMGPTTAISREGWQEAIDVNLTSAFLAARHQIPPLLKNKSGSLIFTSTFCRPYRGNAQHGRLFRQQVGPHWAHPIVGRRTWSRWLARQCDLAGRRGYVDGPRRGEHGGDVEVRAQYARAEAHRER